MTNGNNNDRSMISVLMQLESLARSAETIKALQFIIVNETRKLIPYRQAFLLGSDTVPSTAHHLQCASSIAIVERDAPLSQWLEKLVADLDKKSGSKHVQQLDYASCPEKFQEGWKEYSLPFVLMCPLNLPNGRHIGILWLTREKPWQDNEIALIRRLTETYAHAWYALIDYEILEKKTYHERIVLGSIFFILFSFFIIPIRISTLAPVEVVAKSPTIISSPMDGVIRDITIPPNISVEPGETLFLFEDTDLRNKYEIAEKGLAVAMAEFRQVSQGAFQDSRSSSQVSLLKAQAALRQAERDYALDLLKQVEVKAPASGLLIYSDESDWVGRPVRVGEQVMQIASPEKVELRIRLPVNDSIVLYPGAEIKVFLDYDPLHSIPAVLTYASYEAEITPQDVLAYNITADFADNDEHPRIGLQGTAKIYGERMSLFFYLFRRPIATMRQYIGL